MTRRDFILCGLLSLSLLYVSASAQLQYPLSVAATDTSVLVADRNLPGVWKIESGVATELFKGSKQFRTPLNAVRCVTMDVDGAVLAGDSSTREIYRFDAQGKPTPLTNGGIGTPMSIAVDTTGRIYVADLELHRIYRVPKTGGDPEVVAEVKSPRGICLDGKDGVLVVSHGNDQVVRIQADGKIVPVVKGRPFQFPHNIALGKDGTMYVTDGYARAVWKIDSNAKPTKWASGDPLQNPVGLTAQGDKLLVADPHAQAIFQIDAEGQVKKLAGG